MNFYKSYKINLISTLWLDFANKDLVSGGGSSVSGFLTLIAGVMLSTLPASTSECLI